MGGGRTSFLNSTVMDGYGNTGLRTDGQDLTKMWKDTVNNRSASGSYITNRTGLLNLDINNTDYILGQYYKMKDNGVSTICLSLCDVTLHLNTNSLLLNKFV